MLKTLPDLKPYIEVKKVNVQLDHIPVVIVIPPGIAVAEVVGYMKSQSAKLLKARFAFLRKTYQDKEEMWSWGYCVSSIGLNEKQILAYVEHQSREDRGQLQLAL